MGALRKSEFGGSPEAMAPHRMSALPGYFEQRAAIIAIAAEAMECHPQRFLPPTAECAERVGVAPHRFLHMLTHLRGAGVLSLTRVHDGASASQQRPPMLRRRVDAIDAAITEREKVPRASREALEYRKAVLMAIARKSLADGTLMPTARMIGSVTGFSRNAVYSAMLLLRRRGAVKTQKAGTVAKYGRVVVVFVAEAAP